MITSSKYLAVSLLSFSLAAGYVLPVNAFPAGPVGAYPGLANPTPATAAPTGPGMAGFVAPVAAPAAPAIAAPTGPAMAAGFGAPVAAPAAPAPAMPAHTFTAYTPVAAPAPAAGVGNVCYIKAAPDGDVKCCAIYDVESGRLGETCEKIIKGTAQDHCKVTPGSRSIRCGTDGKVICEKNINGTVTKEPCPTNQPGSPAAVQGQTCPDWLNNGIPHDAATAQVNGDVPAMRDMNGPMIAHRPHTPGIGSYSLPIAETICDEPTDS